jgi:hypothetical protein
LEKDSEDSVTASQAEVKVILANMEHAGDSMKLLYYQGSLAQGCWQQAKPGGKLYVSLPIGYIGAPYEDPFPQLATHPAADTSVCSVVVSLC